MKRLSAWFWTVAIAVGLAGCPTVVGGDEGGWHKEANGFASGPAMDTDGTIYTSIGEFVAGTLMAYSSDGSVRWSQFASEGWGVPVVGPDGDLYVESADFLRRLDADTGAEVYKADVRGAERLAVAADGVAYTLGPETAEQRNLQQTVLHAVSPHGDVLWEVVVDGETVGAPAVAGDGTLLVVTSGSDDSDTLWAYDRSGSLQWSASIADGGTSAAVGGDGGIYVGTSEGLAAFDRDGTPRWTAALGAPGLEPCIGVDGTVYTRTLDGQVVALTDGGQQVWAWSGGAAVTGLTLGNDGAVYTVVAGVDRKLVAIGADGSTSREYSASRAELHGGAPVIGGDGLAAITGHRGVLSSTTLGDPNDPNADQVFSQDIFWHLETYATPADGLIDAPWPREGGGNGNGRRAAPVARTPTDVYGMWALTEAGVVTAVEFLDDGTYVVWTYPEGDAPLVTQRGDFELGDGFVAVTATTDETGSGVVGELQTRALGAASTYATVVLDGPHDGTTRALDRVYALPGTTGGAASAYGITISALTDGGCTQEHGRQVAYLADGGLAVAGDFMFVAELNGGQQIPVEGASGGLFVAVSRAGSWDWLQHWGPDEGIRQAVGLEVAPDGTILVAGPGTEGDPAHLAGVDPAGTILWTRRLEEDVENKVVRHLAVAADGSRILGGAVTEGGGVGPAKGDAFVVKLDADNNELWTRVWEAPGRQGVHAVAAGPEGSVVAVGAFEQQVDFGTGILTAEGYPDAHSALPVESDLFVMSLSSAGDVEWVRDFSGYRPRETTQRYLDVGVDPAGNIAVGGIFHGGINFGHGLLATSDSLLEQNSDVFLARFESDGTPTWSYQLGDLDSFDQFGGVHVDVAGNIAIAGKLGKDLDLGGQTLSTKGDGHFIVQFDTCGQVLWAKDYRPSDHRPVGLDGLGITGAGVQLAVVGAVAGAVDIGDRVTPWSEPPLCLDEAGNSVLKGVDVFVLETVAVGDTNASEDGVIPACETATGTQRLSVVFAGAGGGRVVSDPSGLDCSESCEADLPALTPVTLTVTPDDSSSFMGWGEDSGCSGTDACVLTMSQDRTLEIVFEPPATRFVHRFSGSGVEGFNELEAGPDGEVYAVATMDAGATVDYGAGAATAAGDALVLARYDADGAAEWVLDWPVDDMHQTHDASSAAGVAGVSVVGVSAADELDLGGGPVAAASPGRTLYLARWDGTGTNVLTKRYSVLPWKLAIAAEAGGGHVLAGESSKDAIDFGSGAVAGSGLGFVARVDDAGEAIWARRHDGAATSVVIEPSSGDSIVAGRYDDDFDFGEGPLGLGDGVFVARLAAADGATVWLETVDIANAKILMLPVLSVHPTGGIALATMAGGTDLQLGGKTLVGPSDGLVARLDEDGVASWLATYGDNQNHKTIGAVVMRADGAVFTAVSDDYGTQMTGFSSTGETSWTRFVEGAQTNRVTLVDGVLLPDGDVVLGGWVVGGSSLMGVPLVAEGYSDAVMARFGP